MLTFYPEFEADEITENEIIFLFDLSNSMKGDALGSAKKILLLLLHHLPPKCHFNVITFGASESTITQTDETQLYCTPTGDIDLFSNFLSS